jgi:hypothetical protein
MLKSVIYLLSTILGIVLICLGLRYLFSHHGDIDKHCNCTPKNNFSDTIDISQLKIIVDESKTADFITTPYKLKLDVGPTYLNNGLLTCCGLSYIKYEKDTSKYILIHLNTVSETDRAEIIDQKNDLEYDFEFKITKTFDYFKNQPNA